MISSVIQKIAAEYLTAKVEPFRENELANYIRDEAPSFFRGIVNRDDIKIEGSPGRGVWADVPWIALFNREITLSATRGYYIVYLFDADMSRVSLCLAQGVTAVRDEFKNQTENEMLRRSALIRDRLPRFSKRFIPGPAALGGTTRLAKDYDLSVAFYKPYATKNLPPETALEDDLRLLIEAYDTLFENGGTDNIETAIDAGLDSDLKDQFASIEEKKRYVRHARIERHSGASKIAKTVLGYDCQGCGFNFKETYGEIGKDFIEAHHLIPLASLPEGVPVSMDPVRDFAVLCSNCHRIVHRQTEPLTIAELRALLKRSTD